MADSGMKRQSATFVNPAKMTNRIKNYLTEDEWNAILELAVRRGPFGTRNRRRRSRAAKEGWRKIRLRARLARSKAMDAKPRKPSPKHRRYGVPLRDRIVRYMQPGQWYAARELAEAVGCPGPTPRQIMHQAAPELFQRALNPDFQGHGFGCRVPRYFWRLSPAGEARRAELGGG